MRKEYQNPVVYSTTMKRPQVLVVGAGVAGLACARELSRRDVPAVVLERARGVGGRCATRRVNGEPVDFGLPFLPACSGEFAEALNELDPAGKIPGWPVRVREVRLACNPDFFRPGRRRMARVEGVSAFPKLLAREVDVRLGHDVAALAERDGSVVVRLRDGGAMEAGFLVLACAHSQSRALAEPLVRDWPGAAAGLAALHSLPVLPALTVIAGYGPAAPDPGFDIWYPLESIMLHTISNDSSKRPAPCDRIMVYQARERFSREVVGRPPEEWRRELLWEAGELMGPWAARPAWTQEHVWEDARVRREHILGGPVVFESRDPSVRGPRARVALIGDAFASDPGVEGAYMSGISMGEQIASLPEVRSARLADAG